jgi:chorismate mutase
MNKTKEFFFENEEEARNLLENSRKQIDEIDNDLIDLIYRRTSLAKDVVFAKQYLGMEIYDKNREKSIHDKVNKLASDKNIDEEILSQIMNMLTILSKNEQKEILRRNENGKY